MSRLFSSPRRRPATKSSEYHEQRPSKKYNIKPQEHALDDAECQIDSGLHRLPAELLIQVVSHLTFAELCTLRLCSRPLNDRFTAPGSAVATYWFFSRLRPDQRRLCPVKSPLRPWEWVFAMTRNQNVEMAVAEIVVDHLWAHVLPRRAQTSAVIVAARTRMIGKLAPALGLINHYLSSVHETMLDPSNVIDGTYKFDDTRLHHHSLYLLAEFPIEDVLASHKAWIVLNWLFDSMMKRPSYAGTLERTMRGWIASPIEPELLNLALIHGGLSALKQILGLDTYTQRRKWIEQFLASFDPQTSIRWAERWRQFDSKSAAIDRDMAAQALQVRLDRQYLWTAAATSLLGKAGHAAAVSTDRYHLDLALSGRVHAAAATAAAITDPAHVRSLRMTSVLTEWAGWDAFHGSEAGGGLLLEGHWDTEA